MPCGAATDALRTAADSVPFPVTAWAGTSTRSPPARRSVAECPGVTPTLADRVTLPGLLAHPETAMITDAAAAIAVPRGLGWESLSRNQLTVAPRSSSFGLPLTQLISQAGRHPGSPGDRKAASLKAAGQESCPLRLDLQHRPRTGCSNWRRLEERSRSGCSFNSFPNYLMPAGFSPSSPRRTQG